MFRSILVSLSVAALHAAAIADTLSLSSPVAVVQDATTGKVLYAKNAQQTVSIASITKLVTAMVILDGPSSWLDMSVSIEPQDVDTIKNSSSRLPVGSVWSVRNLLRLALVASDNRAAHALGRVYPGDMSLAMNKKAASLGLKNTRFYDSSGLSAANQSTPLEIARITSFAAQYAFIRDATTSTHITVPLQGKNIQFNNTNAVVRNDIWPSLWVSKTGFTNEAGRCVTMMGKIGERAVTLVLMAGASSLERTKDVQRIQHWLDASYPAPQQEAKTSRKKGGPSATKKKDRRTTRA